MIDDDHLRFSSIELLASQLAAGEISVRDLVAAHLSASDRMNPDLHAFVSIDAEDALETADILDRELRDRGPRSLLHGIPFGIKDVIDTEGVETSAGSRILEGRVPEEDAAVVARMRAAGAVLVGKQTTFEFALGRPDGADRFPAAANVWNPERSTSGSSSGSATAVAAGLCVAALGSDTGGSIRCPAAYAGIVGLKATYGLLPTTGLVPLAWSLDHVGPMARSVSDVEILFGALAHRGHQRDAGEDEDSSLTGVAIGVPWSFIESRDELDPSVMALFVAAVETLEQLGAGVVDVNLPDLEHVHAIWYVITLVEAATYHRRWLIDRFNDYGQGVRDVLPAGLLFSPADYLAALQNRGVLCHQLTTVMDRVDVLATPTMAASADLMADDPEAVRGTSTTFTEMFNLTGQPSLTVPAGFDDHGVPGGLLLSGRLFDEATILRVGHAYAHAAAWQQRHPFAL